MSIDMIKITSRLFLFFSLLSLVIAVIIEVIMFNKLIHKGISCNFVSFKYWSLFPESRKKVIVYYINVVFCFMFFIIGFILDSYLPILERCF